MDVNRKEILEKLEERTMKLTDHWLWTGSCNGGGYGVIQIDYNQIMIHRLAAHLFLELDLDDKKQLALHKNSCIFKNCWNPDHLYVGTHKENTHDMDQLGRAKRGPYKTHCPKGHEYTESNTYINKRGAQTCRECNRLRYYK